MDSVFSKEYRVDTFTSNSHKRLGLLGLVGLLQDIATFHAAQAGFGHEEMLERGVFWVMVRKSIKMKKWPPLFSKLTIKTWTRVPESFYAYRDFEIYWEDDLIGSAATTWVTLSTKDRRPTEIPLENLPIKPRLEGVLDYKAEKIICSTTLKPEAEFITRNTDLDLNAHVNNTKYTQWVLDTIEYQYHEMMRVKEYHINFLSEVKIGDTIRVLKDEENSIFGEQLTYIGQVSDHKKPSMIVKCTYQKND